MRILLLPASIALLAMVIALPTQTLGNDTPTPMPNVFLTDTWDASDLKAIYPPCANEDGPGPCYWDAGSMGNGVGSSFYIGPDFCTYRNVNGAWQRDTDFECVNGYAD